MDESVKWSQKLGEQLIKSVSITFGDTIVQTTAPEHRNGTLEECPWCKNKPKFELSIWGDLHIKEDDGTWTAIENNYVIGKN